MVSAVTVGAEQRGLVGLMDSIARDVENRFPSELIDVGIEIIG